MLELLTSYFEKQEWDYSHDEDNTIFLFGISGENGNFDCVADLKESEKSFIFFSIVGTKTPEEKKTPMAELITRLNFDKFLGNFDLDFEDGEVRYKTSIIYSEIEPDMEWIDNLIMTNLVIMDQCLPGLTGLMYKDLAPLEAYNLIMNKQSAQ